MFGKIFMRKPKEARVENDSPAASGNYTIIAGLGNPGREYAHTRHNVGFDTVDILADRFSIPVDTVKFSAHIGKGMIEGKKVILVKPQTFMNLSGDAISQVVHYFKADPKDGLIVIYDDIDLDAGRLRLRKQGSAGGHNGMKDIIKKLGTNEFYRIRIGVGGKPSGYDLKDYVLGHFTGEERELMDSALIDAASAAASILSDGIDNAMNRYNQGRNSDTTE